MSYTCTVIQAAMWFMDRNVTTLLISASTCSLLGNGCCLKWFLFTVSEWWGAAHLSNQSTSYPTPYNAIRNLTNQELWSLDRGTKISHYTIEITYYQVLTLTYYSIAYLFNGHEFHFLRCQRIDIKCCPCYNMESRFFRYPWQIFSSQSVIIIMRFSETWVQISLFGEKLLWQIEANKVHDYGVRW